MIWRQETSTRFSSIGLWSRANGTYCGAIATLARKTTQKQTTRSNPNCRLSLLPHKKDDSNSYDHPERWPCMMLN